MHLLPEFGRSVVEIIQDGFVIDAEIEMYTSTELSAEGIGKGIIRLAEVIDNIKWDITLILGDRIEVLAAAITSALRNIPVAHIHGGEKTNSGHIDELSRHAITKFSHIHFVATQEAANRVKKLGEEAWRVHVVGAPGLDVILHQPIISREELYTTLKLSMDKPVIVVLQHSVSIEQDEAEYQMRETMEAVIKHTGCQVVAIYPNSDPGSVGIIKVLEEYKAYPDIHVYKNLSRRLFIGLLNNAAVMVGNSSSGIIEAPSFKLPVVNVGSRNRGREHTDNVIFVENDKNAISEAINIALFDNKFKEKVKRCKNPYGDGYASQRIVNILADVVLDRHLLRKQITY
jgi:UDP-N-acetylglucosamine 2-epimerase (non-hydrolysing)/GDP/UDP-N,N'-diacetylbacillosamine 2-epimerase (hydrolysing)